MLNTVRYLGVFFVCALLLGGCAQKQAEPETPPMTLKEFSARFSELSGEEANADELLVLCETALDRHAGSDPRYISTAHSYRSHAYLLKQEHSAAEKAVNKAIKADPSSALAYFTRTDVYYAQKRYDEARDDCFKGTDIMEYEEYREQMRDMCEQSYQQRMALDEGN